MRLTEEERVGRRRAYKRRWYEANKAHVIARTTAYTKANREQARAIQKRWRDRNRESERLRARAKNWRAMPTPTRPEPAVCECCGNPDRKALSLDHCHATGAFRGWLCSMCNLGIGKLGDTVESLQRALEYLKRATQ